MLPGDGFDSSACESAVVQTLATWRGGAGWHQLWWTYVVDRHLQKPILPFGTPRTGHTDDRQLLLACSFLSG